MSRKVPELMLDALADKHSGLIFHNWEDLIKYTTEHHGEQLLITASLAVQTSKKLRMYRYWYKVIVPCAVIGFTMAGYEGVDNVKADYMLRAELAKDFVLGPNGSRTVIVLDKSGMTMPRLHKLLSDAIWFIEETLAQNVPDSLEYKLSKETGIPFKVIK